MMKVNRDYYKIPDLGKKIESKTKGGVGSLHGKSLSEMLMDHLNHSTFLSHEK